MPKKSKNTSNLINPLTNKNFQLVRIEMLKPYANNARKHSPRQIEKLAASISAFGFIVPALIDADSRIIRQRLISGRVLNKKRRKSGGQGINVG